jgi:hypothetical protein
VPTVERIRNTAELCGNNWFLVETVNK